MSRIFSKTASDRMNFGTYLSYAGEAFESYDYFPTLADGAFQYWVMQTPPDKSVILINRELSAGGGPIFYSVFPAASGITEGTALQVYNLRTGGRSSALTVNRATVSSPGSRILKAIARGVSGTANKSTGGATVPLIENLIPAGSQIVLGIEAGGALTDVFIKLDWIELPNLESLSS